MNTTNRGYMRTLMFIALVLGADSCSSSPSPPLGATPVQPPTPRLSTPVQVTPNTSASPVTNPMQMPCPVLTHTAEPPTWKGTSLQAAIYAKDLKQVQRLAVGPALRELDSFEATPLIAAVSPSVPEPMDPPPTAAKLEAEETTQLEIVRELLKRGADPNQRGYQGTTPLQKVAAMGYGDAHSRRMLALLLDAKADIDARDARGTTALMAAARVNRATVVQFLMARGANAGLTDCAGQSALDIARAANAAAVIDVLTRAG